MKIIRTERSRTARAVDTIITALAWIGFIYLVAHGIAELMRSDSGLPEHSLQALIGPNLHTLLIYLIVAAINGLVLLGWARYNQIRFRGTTRRQTTDTLQDDAMMISFQVDALQLATLQQSRISIIEHDPAGHIVAVQPARPRYSST